MVEFEYVVHCESFGLQTRCSHTSGPEPGARPPVAKHVGSPLLGVDAVGRAARLLGTLEVAIQRQHQLGGACDASATEAVEQLGQHEQHRRRLFPRIHQRHQDHKERLRQIDRRHVQHTKALVHTLQTAD